MKLTIVVSMESGAMSELCVPLRRSLIKSWRDIRQKFPKRNFDKRLCGIALSVARIRWSEECLNDFGQVIPLELCRALRDGHKCSLDEALVIGWWFGYTNYLIQIGYRDLCDESHC